MAWRLRFSAVDGGAGREQVLEVITLGYRQAEEVIPVLRPLLAPGGALTGATDRLIIGTTPANLAELKQVLAVLDSKPRQRVICVRQGAMACVARDAASVSGSVGVGSNARMSAPTPPAVRADPGVVVQDGNNRVEGDQQPLSAGLRRDADGAGVGRQQCLHPHRAVGPGHEHADQSYPGATQITQSAGFVDADTGFYVTPRVSGNRVTFNISTARDRVGNPNTGAVNVQRASSLVSGRLGEWIAVGGSNQSADPAQSEPFAQRRYTSGDTRTIMLKVDKVR